ncbi:MAG: HlyD family efflux transporter periplasmic adaptor subunit [Bacteroidota bacterium]
MKTIAKIFLPSLLLMVGCSNNDNQWDAQGQFEATEVMVASEASGKIMEFSIEEGQTLAQNQVYGYIDTMQLCLKKQQLHASILSILSRNSNIKAQITVIDEQIINLKREQMRMVRLIKESAGTQKQLDDINGQIVVLEKQKEATTTNFAQLNAETAPLQSQIDQLNDQIQKSIIKSPISGTVISKYAEKGEIAAFNKALFKIANLTEMTLKAYATAEQLSSIKHGQKVTVLIDTDGKNYKKLEGTISWISDKSEFTPKTIQTRNERANLVYAIKIKVKNDGTLRIGMPGEVKF